MPDNPPLPDDAPHLTPEQLRVGLFICLDLSWMDHPFAFSRFKIRSEEQVATLRELGLERIRYDPARSDCEPLPASAAGLPVESAVAEPAAPTAATLAMAEKQARVERLSRIRKDIEAVEKRFMQAADSLKAITRNVYSRPAEAYEAADGLVGALVETALSDSDVKLHAMGNALGEDVYFHSLNVTVLALMLGRAVHLRSDELHQLGLGALFHDIGLIEIPDALLIRRESLNKAEQALYETHCVKGVKIASKLGLAAPSLAVIAQHHERADGSGYPEHLTGDQINLFARIVAITNAYDNLCNPANLAVAQTPYEALSQMFALQRTRFDETLFRSLIRCLGVYPPGSLVQLSNEMFGLVLSVNPQHPLQPNVLLYDPEVPKEAALIVDLEREPTLKISKNLRAALLPREVFNYLNPRQRVSYYFDREAPKRDT